MRGRMLLFCWVLMNSACSGVYYYPDHLIYSNPEAEGHKLTEFDVKTPDDESLKAWKIHARVGNKASVIQFHGNAQNMSSHYRILSWLPNKGINLYTFDYRGFGKSTGSPDPEGLVQDGIVMIRKVCKDVKHPVFIVGQSLGGAVAIPALGTMGSHCICGLVIDSSFSSYRRVVQQKLQATWLTRLFSFPLSMLFSESQAPEKFTSKLVLPTRVLHSRGDRVIPYSEGQRLFRDLGSADKEFWDAKNPQGRFLHHIAGFSDSEELRRSLLEFIEEAGATACQREF